MATTFTTNLGLDKPAISDTGWGGIRNTNMDDLDSEIVKPRLIQSALTWAATTTVDLSLARVFTGTNTGVSTIAFTNVPATFPNGAVVPVVRVWLIITNGGANAITWPASVTWLNGAAPLLKTAGVDVVELVTRDGGTIWYGTGAAPRAKVFHSANQSTTTAADLVLAWDSESFDVGTLHDNAVNNSRITVPIAGGVWLLTATVRWAGNTTGFRRAKIRNQAGTIVGIGEWNGQTNDHNVIAHALVNNPAAADWFDVQVIQNSGGALNVIAGENVTYLTAVRLT